MKRLIPRLREFLTRDESATMVEYGLVVFMIAVLSLAALLLWGPAIRAFPFLIAAAI